VGVRQLDLPDDGLANAGHTHDLEPGKRSQQRAQPSKDNRVVVGEDDRTTVSGTPSVLPRTGHRTWVQAPIRAGRTPGTR
jgi:hypothetical protein